MVFFPVLRNSMPSCIFWQLNWERWNIKEIDSVGFFDVFDMHTNLVVMWEKVSLYFENRLAFLSLPYTFSGSLVNLSVTSLRQHCTSLPPLVSLSKLNRDNPCVSVWLQTLHGVCGKWHVANKVMQLCHEAVIVAFTGYFWAVWFTKCRLFLKCLKMSWMGIYSKYQKSELNAVSVCSPSTDSYMCFISYSLCLFSQTSTSLLKS